MRTIELRGPHEHTHTQTDVPVISESLHTVWFVSVCVCFLIFVFVHTLQICVCFYMPQWLLITQSVIKIYMFTDMKGFPVTLWLHAACQCRTQCSKTLRSVNDMAFRTQWVWMAFVVKLTIVNLLTGSTAAAFSLPQKKLRIWGLERWVERSGDVMCW